MTEPAPSAAALTEQERAQLHNAGMTMPDAFPVGSIGHIRWSAVIASIESILAARLADSRPVVSEAAAKALEDAAEAMEAQKPPEGYVVVYPERVGSWLRDRAATYRLSPTGDDSSES